MPDRGRQTQLDLRRIRCWRRARGRDLHTAQSRRPSCTAWIQRPICATCSNVSPITRSATSPTCCRGTRSTSIHGWISASLPDPLAAVSAGRLLSSRQSDARERVFRETWRLRRGSRRPPRSAAWLPDNGPNLGRPGPQQFSRSPPTTGCRDCCTFSRMALRCAPLRLFSRPLRSSDMRAGYHRWPGRG